MARLFPIMNVPPRKISDGALLGWTWQPISPPKYPCCPPKIPELPSANHRIFNRNHAYSDTSDWKEAKGRRKIRATGVGAWKARNHSVWDIMRQKISLRRPFPNSKKAKIEAWKDEWQKLDVKAINALIERVLEKLKQCIADKGWNHFHG